jgi:hypothetical protein
METPILFAGRQLPIKDFLWGPGPRPPAFCPPACPPCLALPPPSAACPLRPHSCTGCCATQRAGCEAGRGPPACLRRWDRFGYEQPLVWWMLLVVLAYIVFFRVTSILALKYLNFLRR